MNRPLTEELQSVLREHSLDAPEPQPTIDAVFARLGIDQQAPPRVAAAAAGGAGVRPALRRPTRHQLVLAVAGVAAAAVVLAGAVGLIRSSGSDSRNSAASSVGMAAAPKSQAPASGAGSRGRPGLAVGPDVTGPASAGPGAGWLAGLAGCGGGDLVTSGTASGPAQGRSADLSVGYASCVQADGLSGAGTVVLYREPAGSSTATVVRVLIAPSSSLRLMSVVFDGTTVTVRAIDGAAGPDQGSVSDYSFTVTADGSVLAQHRTPVAAACTAADLSLKVVDGTAGAVIQLTDTGGRACAVSGVPIVAAGSGQSTGVPFSPAALAPGSAGWGGPAAVVLRPGSVASARLQPVAATAAPACSGSLTRIEVSLPGVGRIGAVDYRGRYCAVRVSPLVSGSGG